jgi:nicotinamidase-related amidase
LLDPVGPKVRGHDHDRILEVDSAALRIGQPAVVEDLEQDVEDVDRTSINAWEDADFLAAVRATGRRKLIICALWTEMCMAFPALDALREGYDVCPVAGGSSADQLAPARGRAPARLGP